MGIFLIIAGAVLIYFGMKFKIGDKKVSEMDGGQVITTGLKGYLKVMMIVGGVALIMFGLIWSCASTMM